MRDLLSQGFHLRNLLQNIKIPLFDMTQYKKHYRSRYRYAVWSIVGLFFLCYLYSGRVVSPSDNEVSLFTTHHNDFLKKVVSHVLEHSQHTVTLRMFALQDPYCIRWLQHHNALIETVEVDAHHTLLPVPVTKTKIKGLMHEKMLIVDDRFTLLGSTNWTFEALHIQDNMMILINNPSFAYAAKHRINLSLLLNHQLVELYHLPDPLLAYHMLLRSIHAAHRSIFIAMFCLTSPRIIAALHVAQQRGVSVTIVLDRHQKDISLLKGLPIYYSNNHRLFHYKFAWIDTMLCTGSVNWTEAGLTKNQETLVLMHNLTSKQTKVLQKTKDRILRSSVPIA